MADSKLPDTLIVNLSLSKIKIIIFDNGGNVIYQDWLPIKTAIKDNFVEQNPNEWWSQLVLLLDKASKTKEFSDIKYISVTSSALCLVSVNSAGEPLINAIMVSDKRAQKEANYLKKSKAAAALSNYPSFVIEPSFMIPKIMWIRKHKPKTFNKVYKFLSSNDFLIYKLTGKIATDVINAEKFYFNSKEDRYEPQILKLIGLKRNKLPKVVNIGTNIGGLKKDLVQRFKISTKPEVIVGTYDAICAVLGSGVSAEGELANVCGTCSSYRMFSKKSLGENPNGILSQYLKWKDMYIVGGSNNLEGGLLEWAKQCFYGEECQKDDRFLYRLMESDAKESSLGAHGIIFLPYLIGERVPFWDPHVRGAFFGVERFHTRKDFIRSIFEAIGFQAKLIIDTIENKGVEIKNIKISGGLANIDFMSQLRANILGKPIYLLDEVETTALGSFIIIQMATGKIRSIIGVDKFTKIKQKFIPDKKKTALYDKLFSLYKRFYNTNQKMFIKRGKVYNQIERETRIVDNL